MGYILGVNITLTAQVRMSLNDTRPEFFHNACHACNSYTEGFFLLGNEIVFTWYTLKSYTRVVLHAQGYTFFECLCAQLWTVCMLNNAYPVPGTT